MNSDAFDVDGTCSPFFRAVHFQPAYTEDEICELVASKNAVTMFLHEQAVTAQEMYEAQYVSLSASLSAKIEDINNGER